MTQEGLHVEGVSATLDGKTILNEISFDVRPGEMVGVLGPNGAGKSSLLHVLASLLQPDRGVVHLDGADLKIFRFDSGDVLWPWSLNSPPSPLDFPAMRWS